MTPPLPCSKSPVHVLRCRCPWGCRAAHPNPTDTDGCGSRERWGRGEDALLAFHVRCFWFLVGWGLVVLRVKSCLSIFKPGMDNHMCPSTDGLTYLVLEAQPLKSLHRALLCNINSAGLQAWRLKNIPVHLNCLPAWYRIFPPSSYLVVKLWLIQSRLNKALILGQISQVEPASVPEGFFAVTAKIKTKPIL